VRIVAITHDFQAVVYNKLRDAHSQQVRKKANEDIRRLLACNQQDSLLGAIKMLGFADTRAYLVSLDKIQAAARQLRARGVVLDKLPLNAVVQAYQIIASRSGYVYPPIKAQKVGSKANSTSSKTNTIGICELCFLNNCDECGEGGGNGTLFEQPSDGNGGGGSSGSNGISCRANAAAKRQNAIAQAENMLYLAIIGCGSSAWAAGEIACGGTMVTIVGAPIGPEVGIDVCCFVVTTCSTFAFVDYRLKIQQAELDYQATIAGCPK
jgi:hypothetical protein